MSLFLHTYRQYPNPAVSSFSTFPRSIIFFPSALPDFLFQVLILSHLITATSSSLVPQTHSVPLQSIYNAATKCIFLTSLCYHAAFLSNPSTGSSFNVTSNLSFLSPLQLVNISQSSQFRRYFPGWKKWLKFLQRLCPIFQLAVVTPFKALCKSAHLYLSSIGKHCVAH